MSDADLDTLAKKIAKALNSPQGQRKMAKALRGSATRQRNVFVPPKRLSKTLLRSQVDGKAT